MSNELDELDAEPLTEDNIAAWIGIEKTEYPAKFASVDRESCVTHWRKGEEAFEHEDMRLERMWKEGDVAAAVRWLRSQIQHNCMVFDFEHKDVSTEAIERLEDKLLEELEKAFGAVRNENGDE